MDAIWLHGLPARLLHFNRNIRVQYFRHDFLYGLRWPVGLVNRPPPKTPAFLRNHREKLMYFKVIFTKIPKMFKVCKYLLDFLHTFKHDFRLQVFQKKLCLNQIKTSILSITVNHQALNFLLHTFRHLRKCFKISRFFKHTKLIWNAVIPIK